MRLLFLLLLLSLPLFLLFGLAKTEDANGEPAASWICTDIFTNVYNCTREEPYCQLQVDVDPNQVYKDSLFGHKTVRLAHCASAEKDGCSLQQMNGTKYLCFCDSRKAERCSEVISVKDNLTTIAVEMYKVAHSTTTPDLNVSTRTISN